MYVHFPWCLAKCPYCDFVSFAAERSDIPHERYAGAVVREIERRSACFQGKRATSVFFGGGTPSLWEPASLGRVLRAIERAAGGFSADVEITAESNPTSLDRDRAVALRDLGVNRLSIGVQGLDADRLRFLGRLHDVDGGLRAVRAAIASGMPRVSADLVFGVAGGRPQTPDEAADEAGRIADLGLKHVSAYSLTIEPGTDFGARARKGKLPILADETHADAFLAVEAALERRGLAHYEISNYAVPGEEARHNLGYWRGDDYVGLGCAAFGTIAEPDRSATRYRNHRDPARYLRAAEHDEPLEEMREPLDPETRLRERLMLGLRVAEGVDLARSAADLGIPAWTPPRLRAADRLEKRGHLERTNDRIRVPKRAWLFADGIAAELF